MAVEVLVGATVESMVSTVVLVEAINSSVMNSNIK